MRVLLLLLTLSLSGCILEAIGAYTCDSYCGGIADKVQTCAEDQGMTFDELTGGDRATVLDQCQVEIDGRNLNDVQCQAETATINNSDCQTVVDTAKGYL